MLLRRGHAIPDLGLAEMQEIYAVEIHVLGVTGEQRFPHSKVEIGRGDAGQDSAKALAEECVEMAQIPGVVTALGPLTLVAGGHRPPSAALFFFILRFLLAVLKESAQHVGPIERCVKGEVFPKSTLQFPDIELLRIRTLPLGLGKAFGKLLFSGLLELGQVHGLLHHIHNLIHALLSVDVLPYGAGYLDFEVFVGRSAGMPALWRDNLANPELFGKRLDARDILGEILKFIIGWPKHGNRTRHRHNLCAHSPESVARKCW